METRKIATACFIGGFICVAVAVGIDPMFWWIGMLAGFASGYLAYEFRSVLQAVPIAWQSAKKGSGKFWQVLQKVLVWFFKPHPFLHPFMATYVFLGIMFILHIGSLDLFLLMFVPFALTFIIFMPLSCLIEFGAKKEGYKAEYIEESYYYSIDWMSGSAVETMTYQQALNWAIRGISELVVAICYFCFWQIWKWSVIGILETTYFLCRFLKKFFILIHSQKRLLCGIDGTIGGAIAYVWLASSSVGIWENTILCIFGGLIGAGFGVVNYEIVSKRILRLATANSA